MRCERCGCVGVSRQEGLVRHEVITCALLSLALVVPGVIYAARRAGQPYCVRCKARVEGNGIAPGDPIIREVILPKPEAQMSAIELACGMRRSPAGFTLLVTALSMMTIIGILALCCDYGLKYLVNDELQRAADASAIAGAQRLLGDAAMPEPTVAAVISEAKKIASENPATLIDGSPTVELRTSDIELGFWDEDTRTFVAEPLPEEANAVRTTLVRSKARGNAIRTTLSPMLGVDLLEASRSAIARLEHVPDYGLIGLNSFKSQGILSVTGTGGPSTGNVASNANVVLNLLGLIGVTWIDGCVATPGTVQGPSIGILTKVRDGVKHPKRPFRLPPVSVSAAQAKNDNWKLGSALNGNGDLVCVGVLNLQAGVYYVNNVTVVLGAILNIQGPVTIYVRDNVTVLGAVLCPNNDASQFKIRIRGPGSVTIAANLTLCIDIYAPTNDITVAAGVLYYGRLIGKTINILGTSFFVLSSDLAQPELGHERARLVL